MTLKENHAELQRDVRKLRAELGSLAGNVPQTDTTKTIREQVYSFEAERAALLEIEGRQPAVIAFAVDDTGKPIKPKLPLRPAKSASGLLSDRKAIIHGSKTPIRDGTFRYIIGQLELAHSKGTKEITAADLEKLVGCELPDGIRFQVLSVAPVNQPRRFALPDAIRAVKRYAETKQ